MDFVEPIQILNELPGGGLGQVFRCRDAAGTLFVAKLPKDSSDEAQRMLDSEERRLKRFQSIRVVKHLGPIRHSDGRRGFAMELLEESLASLVRREGSLSELRSLRLLMGAADGLLQVHTSAVGAFHGDVKPANILHSKGETKLADFGLARGGVGQTMLFGPHDGGTPGYLPPEGRSWAPGDVYSLGVTLCALMTGREPTSGGEVAIPSASKALEVLLNRMLAGDPLLRPEMIQVVPLLEGLLAGAERRREAWLKPLKFAAALGGVALLIFVAGRAFAGSKK